MTAEEFADKQAADNLAAQRIESASQASQSAEVARLHADARRDYQSAAQTRAQHHAATR